MDEFGKMAVREREALRIARRQRFWLHFVVWAAFSVFLTVIWVLTTRGFPWFIIPILAWAIPLAAHWASAYVLRSPEEILIDQEQREAAHREQAGVRDEHASVGDGQDGVRSEGDAAQEQRGGEG